MNSWRQVFSDWFAPGLRPASEKQSIGHRFLLFGVFVVLAYGIVWSALYLVQDALARLMAQTVQVWTTLAGTPMEFWANGLEVSFRIQSGKQLEGYLDTRPILANMPLLLTLVLVTPGLRWSRRIAYVLGAGALLSATHLVFLYIKVQLVLIAAGHPEAGSAGFWQTLDNFFEVTGKTFFPIVIWLVFGLPYMLGATDRRKALPRPHSRNALCPCGSGKKYKKCCGGISGA
jgi:hypothetical protein